LEWYRLHQAGRLVAWYSLLKMQPLYETIAGARIFDLAQPYFPGMPHHPSHPPFLFGLVKQHGDYVGPAGNSSAADAFALGSHVGTHIDALSHYSRGGKLFGGVEAVSAQSHQQGLSAHAIDTVAPIVRRGVLLDVAGHEGVDALPADFEITPERLDQIVRAQGIAVERGDVVLLRTGWARYFGDAAKFVSEVRGPGPGKAGAEWLSRRGVFAAGSDTLAFEKVPDAAMPVHVHLLVESGIHIIECLNLEELAAAGQWTFVLVAAPLKIRGATGSPVRPLAIVPHVEGACPAR
jgi:kynurenine formamidase